jgi:hypothetical protein
MSMYCFCELNCIIIALFEFNNLHEVVYQSSYAP